MGERSPEAEGQASGLARYESGMQRPAFDEISTSLGREGHLGRRQLYPWIRRAVR